MDLVEILSKASPSTGKLLAPDHEAYTVSNSSYFTVFESQIKPAYIVQPASSQDVSNILKALKPSLEQGKIKLAVRGTGHTPFAGSANIENGLTIDLRGLKGLSLDKNHNVVTIGVGETWSSVYEALEKDGVTTAGGRVGRVGVGGLILGGECASAHLNLC
jgi:FAD/FMN-containing dehydrogenase